MVRAMTRDEDMYPEPNVFRPDRFAHQDNATAEVTDPKNTVFGFGRRYVLAFYMMCK